MILCAYVTTSELYRYNRLRGFFVGVVTYALYACVADCEDAMADAREDTAGCAQASCLYEKLLK